MSTYKIGDIIEAKVSGLANYGIFVGLEDGYTGLIHISEVSSRFVKDLSDYVSLGEHILCEVLDVYPKSSQLKLSIKNINYKLIPHYGKIKDTEDGFKLLQMHLPVWIREKSRELNLK